MSYRTATLRGCQREDPGTGVQPRDPRSRRPPHGVRSHRSEPNNGLIVGVTRIKDPIGLTLGLEKDCAENLPNKLILSTPVAWNAQRFCPRELCQSTATAAAASIFLIPPSRVRRQTCTWAERTSRQVKIKTPSLTRENISQDCFLLSRCGALTLLRKSRPVSSPHAKTPRVLRVRISCVDGPTGEADDRCPWERRRAFAPGLMPKGVSLPPECHREGVTFRVRVQTTEEDAAQGQKPKPSDKEATLCTAVGDLREIITVPDLSSHHGRYGHPKDRQTVRGAYKPENTKPTPFPAPTTAQTGSPGSALRVLGGESRPCDLGARRLWT